MARKQTRRSISIKGITYQRTKDFCEAHGLSQSGFVEDLIEARLGKPSEKEIAVYVAADAQEQPASSVSTVEVPMVGEEPEPLPTEVPTVGEVPAEPATTPAEQSLVETPPERFSGEEEGSRSEVDVASGFGHEPKHAPPKRPPPIQTSPPPEKTPDSGEVPAILLL